MINILFGRYSLRFAPTSAFAGIAIDHVIAGDFKVWWILAALAMLLDREPLSQKDIENVTGKIGKR